MHKFQLYASSYFKLFIDDKLVFDRWRQNWNPLYHPFDVTDGAGQAREVPPRVDPGRRLHRAAAQRSPARRATSFAHVHVRSGSRDRLLVHRGQRPARRDRRLSRAHRQVGDAAALGVRLLAEPRAIQDPGRDRRRGEAVPQAQDPARQHRARLELLARERLGFSRLRQVALPRSEEDGRRHPRA